MDAVDEDSDSSDDELIGVGRAELDLVVREAVDQAATLQEIDRLSKYITSAAHSDNTKISYEGGQNRFFKWLLDQPDVQSCLTPGVDAAAATIEDIVVPLSQDIMKRYLVFVTFKDNETLNLMSYSTVSGAISSISNLHTMRGTNVPPDIQIILNLHKKGVQRRISQLKQQGLRKLLEGKAPASIESYKHLCKYACTFKGMFSLLVFC